MAQTSLAVPLALSSLLHDEAPMYYPNARRLEYAVGHNLQRRALRGTSRIADDYRPNSSSSPPLFSVRDRLMQKEEGRQGETGSSYVMDLEKQDMKETSVGKNHKTVSFSHVLVREYSIVIGDHPRCHTSGLPLSLGWSHTPSVMYDIDVYEKIPRCAVNLRNWATPRKLTYLERKNLLRRVSGLSESDIVRIERNRTKRDPRNRVEEC